VDQFSLNMSPRRGIGSRWETKLMLLLSLERLRSEGAMQFLSNDR
jgi:hypothetical protein